ncbi:MAG: LysR substrate-binding domain-containing protein [Burkholderiaceae bacterium]
MKTSSRRPPGQKAPAQTAPADPRAGVATNATAAPVTQRQILNLRHLEAFRAVMLAGTVVGAAQWLNLTQPGVSRILSLMELRLGYALFERRGRRLVPTPEAEALYRELDQIYSGIERLSQVAQDIGQQRVGALRIACLPALAQGLVPDAIADLLQDRPGVQVYLQSLPSRQIARAVATQQFDLGVIELPISHPGITAQALPESEMVAVLPKDHPLGLKKRLRMRDLDGERMVLLAQESLVRYLIDEAFSRARAAPLVVIETPSSPIACALVAAGSGITLVSRWTAQALHDDRLIIRPLVESLHSRYALIHPEGRLSALARAWGQALRARMLDAETLTRRGSPSPVRACASGRARRG